MMNINEVPEKILRDFKTMRDESITRRSIMKVLDIDNKEYEMIYDEYSAFERQKSIHRVDIYKVLKDFANGMSVYHLLDKYGFRFISLKALLTNRYSFIETNRDFNKSLKEFGDKLKEEYITNGKDSSIIASELGISKSSIIKAIKKFGLIKTNKPISVRKSRIKRITIKRKAKFIFNNNKLSLLCMALFSGVVSNKDTEFLVNKYNVTPRFVDSLKEDYKFIKESKDKNYMKMIDDIKEGKLTLNEIRERYGIKKSVYNFCEYNIAAAMAVGKWIGEIDLEEHRRCVYPCLIGNYVYAKRVKGHKRLNLKDVYGHLSRLDPMFEHDLEILKHFIFDLESDINKIPKSESLKVLEVLDKYYVEV